MKKYFSTWYTLFCMSSYPTMKILLYVITIQWIVAAFTDLSIYSRIEVMSTGLSAITAMALLSFGFTTCVYLLHTLYLILIKIFVNRDFAIVDHLYDVYIGERI